jgi:cell division septal protein FtsQ
MSSSVTSIAEWQKRVAALQAKVLGLISYGIVLFDGCGMTRLSTGLSKVEQVPAGRLRQRLRECSYEAEAKRGKKRREVDVRACFGDLLAGILRDWHGEKTLALA